MIATPSSVRNAQRRVDRLTKRVLRVEELVADMAAGLSLHRGLDRYRRVQWVLSDNEVYDAIAREVIRRPCIAGVGDSLFQDLNELSQTFRYIGDEQPTSRLRSRVHRHVATFAARRRSDQGAAGAAESRAAPLWTEVHKHRREGEAEL